jgi:hypothetical protein
MNQSENPAYAMPIEFVVFFAKVQGQGAAAPIRCPTTVSATSWRSFMLASNNFVSTVATDITRSGVGVYTAKLRDTFPSILDIDAGVAGNDGKQIQVTDYNPSTQVISFTTYAMVGGAAVDLASTDFVTFTISAQKLKPTY